MRIQSYSFGSFIVYLYPLQRFFRFNSMKNDRLTYIIVLSLIFLISGTTAFGQVKITELFEVDKTIHNFGEILEEEGAVDCTFTVKNVGNKAGVIYSVISTCGCTKIQWTKEPIKPGETGKITVTYTNDEGPYPFDKNITVYFSDQKKPVVLKLRGITRAKAIPLEEEYKVRFGDLGIKSPNMKCGNLQQGGMRSNSEYIANLSDSPMTIKFGDISPELEVNVTPNPIPARSKAELTFSIKASRNRWGKQFYYATPIINGRTYRNKTTNSSRFSFWAFTIENFDHLSIEEKDHGPLPMFEESAISFGEIKKGERIQVTFEMSNIGKTSLRFYSLNIDTYKYAHSRIPALAPEEKGSFTVSIDTKRLPKGEFLAIVSLTTNSPLRPYVNLFISGTIK